MGLHIICGVKVSCLRPARSATGQESQSVDKAIKTESKDVARICDWTKFMTDEGCGKPVPLHTEDNKNANSYGDDGKNNNFIGFLIFSSPLSSLYYSLSSSSFFFPSVSSFYSLLHPHSVLIPYLYDFIPTIARCGSERAIQNTKSP
jgi:hypothetical protein